MSKSIVVYTEESKQQIQEFLSKFPDSGWVNEVGGTYLPHLNMAIVDSKHIMGSEFAPNVECVCPDSEVQAIFFGEAYHRKEVSPETYEDTNISTWGLQAVWADDTPYTGKGIKVAVLDTGFDKDHPDFKGRKVTMESFIPGQSAQDGHGHGTHCIGTACGYLDTNGRRYGLAYQSEILAGKVLSNSGGGTMSGILQGINWAIDQGAHVISMSLGNSLSSYDAAYEAAAQRALKQGSLIVAATGNHRPGTVGQPANSPSIVAVGALNRHLKLAPFSCGSGTAPGSEVSVIAPGVDVYSCIPGGKYAIWSGTSMATPHVAGVAALWAECDKSFRGARLREVIQTYTDFVDDIDYKDQGEGLVMTPW